MAYEEKLMEKGPISIDINYEINRLLQYGIRENLIEEEDMIYIANRIIAILKLKEFVILEDLNIGDTPLHEILDNILDFAYECRVLQNNDVTYRDILDTEIMNCLMNNPSVINRRFKELYEEDKRKATDYYYGLSIASNYIRKDRIKKNLKWKSKTKYGDLDITINLSKPEKDPKLIALARNMPQNNYPKCALCYENVGFEGSINQAARQNHRVIPLDLNDEKWYLQYSPYVYYNEHCIVFKKEHSPMKIVAATFKRLLDFIEQFPHYFLGSNADLPIVGGSILSHDHFQGGNYEFPMAKAEKLYEASIDGYEGVNVQYINWPLDVIRITGNSKDELSELAYKIFTIWQKYTHKEIGIEAFSKDTPHNTITPIARRRGRKFQLDLVLRNNRTDENHPYGIYHPDESLHHIKKENIGLIEVMGLAVLPARLKEELKLLESVMVKKEDVSLLDTEDLEKHKDWCLKIMSKYDNINESNVQEILQHEVGMKFMSVLECCSVFRMGNRKEAFYRFVNEINSKINL
ncbi:MAG: UDP-glucose--hexose-1-phosphate uridylyltransferase [Clostridium sp.]|uniref:UDP-glucose--hexose-1-phosphate uridylyltransferase n=1 Tax=Clostridium sp. TaxID=1506 RepID=UPI002A86CC49|nr:UDP-glucose--hexose-1-phosphate uridylyltransferase [Clostridium sp.]MDY5099342.1 UDP-glucose--hexose-1-phosphate uridylyltransferase [Clostridium sp.]